MFSISTHVPGRQGGVRAHQQHNSRACALIIRLDSSGRVAEKDEHLDARPATFPQVIGHGTESVLLRHSGLQRGTLADSRCSR
jgi:hypothetical protein